MPVAADGQVPGISRRAIILREAAALFAAHGVAATTVRQIADQAGVLSGSLYHHFRSKEVIAQEIVIDYLDDLRARYQALDQGDCDPLQRLQALVTVSLQAARDNPHAVEIYQNEATLLRSVPRADHIATAARDVQEFWTRVIDAAVDAGQLRADLSSRFFHRLLRDAAGLRAAVDRGVSELGRLDIVSANAAITSVQKYSEVTAEIWNTTLDVNLTGVWNTCAAAIPHLIATGGGSITITSSSAGARALPFYLPYVTAKHGLVGMARTLALELADQNIRVNLIHPTGVDTPQGHSAVLPGLLDERPDLRPLFMNTLPVSHIQPADVSSALLYLSSDDARYVTGACLMVDAGSTIR